MNKLSSKCVLLFFTLIGVVVNVNMQFLGRLDINTRDSWFSHQQKKIAWTARYTQFGCMCVLPLNLTTLSLIDCENNGQIVKSISTEANNTIIESSDFNPVTNFYSLLAQDSSGNSCQLGYLFRIPPTVLTEVRAVSEGSSVCINVVSSLLIPGISAFWQEEIGSTINCYCPIFLSTFISFSDCYCLQRPPNGFNVSLNVATADLCWKNINFARNGSIVGIVIDDYGLNCANKGGCRTFLKMIVIIVEKIVRSTSVIVQEHTLPRISLTNISTVAQKNIPKPTSVTSLLNLVTMKLTSKNQQSSDVTSVPALYRSSTEKSDYTSASETSFSYHSSTDTTILLSALKLTSKNQQSSYVTSVPALYSTEKSDYTSASETSFSYHSSTDTTILLSASKLTSKNQQSSDVTSVPALYRSSTEKSDYTSASETSFSYHSSTDTTIFLSALKLTSKNQQSSYITSVPALYSTEKSDYINASEKSHNSTDATILLSAGISSLATIFVLEIILIVLITVIIWKTKAKKLKATIDKVDPIYESPTFSMENIEPLYEDITLSPNAMTTGTMVSTEPNEAYVVRKTSKHVSIGDMRMEDNEAYAVRNVTATVHSNVIMENNEAYDVTQNVRKHATVQNIAMEDNEAYQVFS